jgi:D-beta-D-heptose 7-phosphate kinase/D-beta-D-heptose 1-phosphate adenosyltransferase
LKTRVLSTHQHIVRFDKESKVPVSTDFGRRLLEVLGPVLSQVTAVILSDYGKGLIAPSLISWVTHHARKRKIPVFVDPKPENFRHYRRVTCVTPNISEAFLGMGQLPKTDNESVEAVGRKILKTLGLRELIITRGSLGMTVFTANSANGKTVRLQHIPTRAREVFDVTGAGDTVIAVYALSVCAGATSIEAAQIANVAAGIVVGKPGTATVTRLEIQEALRHDNP